MPSPSSIAEKEPILDYTNWHDGSEDWGDHLAALDLWQYTDPTTQGVLPLPNNTIVKQGRKFLSGQTTLRDVWIALRAGCDRGTILPLISKVEAFPGGETECQYLSSRQYSELRQVRIISNVAAAFCRA